MIKIYLDAGHGGADPGAIGHGLQEKVIVLDLAQRMERMLKNYPQTIVKLSRREDVTKSLHARTNEANRWGADIYLSLHCNAFNGKARGYEDFTYHELAPGAKARTYQASIHQHVLRATGLPNRGKKTANFHVLRESHMPAVLTENGFIDHPLDAKRMKQATWREKVAAAHVAALVDIFQLKQRKLEENYSVITGSFLTRTNAEARKLLLKSRGFAAEIIEVTVQGKPMYRVQAGIFATLAEATVRQKQLKLNGFETFVVKK